jgi:uncharacterized protein YndB with AHSA1/START domain
MIDEAGRVVHEIVLPQPRSAVFDLLTDPALLVRWIGVTADLEPSPGGRFRFEVQPGQHCEGEYVDVQRPARVAFTWGWTDPAWELPPGSSLVEIELSDDPAGTRLRLLHSRLPGELRLLHDEGWTTFLARLVAVAGGHEPGEYPSGDPRAAGVTTDAEPGR